MFGTYQQEVERLTGLTVEEEVLKGLSVLLKKTVHARWAVVYFRDRERHGFDPARSCGLPQRNLHLFEQLPLPPDKIPQLKSILHQKKHLLIPNAGQSELITPELRGFLQRLTLLAVPMIVRNQVTGIVFVARDNEYPPFTLKEVELVRLMVSHAALVASHIRLFNESLEMAEAMARHSDVISTLDEINKSISSSLSHEKIIDSAIERIGWIIQCDFVAVLVEAKSELVVQASRATGLEIPEACGTGNRLIGDNLARTAFTEGESRFITSLARVKELGVVDTALRDAGLQALIAIPLASKHATRGVLLFGRMQPGVFTIEDTFAIEKVAAQLAVALENARLYEEMRELFISTVASLANAIDVKSPWTKGHSERVMHLCVALAKEMGLDEALVERVRLGGLLHDIGKIGVIEALLDKPSGLSEEEISPMRLHPEMGVEILKPIEKLHDVLPGILYHHERYDGCGYPHGLKGDEIPLEARIICVADSYDAILSHRPYKKGTVVAEALHELLKNSGSQFDPAVVSALERHLGRRTREITG